MPPETPRIEESLRTYVSETRAALEAPYLLDGVRRMAELFLEARSHGRLILFFGNGGSASTASHFVVDIMKGTWSGKGRTFRCVALNDDTPTVTAWANDRDYSVVFAEQVRALASPGDVIVAISGSGNSPNVLEAVKVAKSIGTKTIGLTGIGGGKLKGMVDVPIVVPSMSMQHTEDLHIVIMHFLTAYLRDVLPGNEST